MDNNQQTSQTIVSSERLLNAAEVAYMLHLSRSSTYDLMQSGELPTVRIRGCRRVRLQDLEAFIVRNIYSIETGA